MTRTSRTPWPRWVYISELSLRSSSDIDYKLSSRLHPSANQNLIVLQCLQNKFQKRKDSHIDKSTQNNSLPGVPHFPASHRASRIGDARNARSLAPLALASASAPVSYLGPSDLNLASGTPGLTTAACTKLTVHSHGMHPDSAGSTLNSRPDCLAVFLHAQQPILDYGWIADDWIADVLAYHQLRHDYQQSIHNFHSSYYKFTGSCFWLSHTDSEIEVLRWLWYCPPGVFQP